DYPEVQRALKPLADVGLEYLRVGQPVPTLSGGEAQRLKLAGHLVEAASNTVRGERGKLFLFDEPTTGLHFDDVAKLLSAFRQLIAAGHSLVRSEEHTSELQSRENLVCRLLLEKKKNNTKDQKTNHPTLINHINPHYRTP